MKRLALLFLLAACKRDAPPDDAHAVAAYVEAAKRQLATEAQQKQAIVDAMVALDPAQPPSVRIQTILESTRQTGAVAWHVSFMKSGALAIPPACAEAHALLTELHQQREAALKELLLYFNDRDESHLRSGTLSFQRSDTLAEPAALALERLGTNR